MGAVLEVIMWLFVANMAVVTLAFFVGFVVFVVRDIAIGRADRKRLRDAMREDR